MNNHFEDIEYLKTGNAKQRRAYETLIKHRVMDSLESFSPILVGTIPIEIDIETSDLDIICCYSDRGAFMELVVCLFGTEKGFFVDEQIELNTVVAGFWLDDFEIEIFGQNIPAKQQNGYRHMLVEYQLLQERGEAFRQEILALKKQGYKTEPAFGIALGLKGDPYLELLRLIIE